MYLHKGKFTNVKSVKYIVIAGYDDVLYNAIYKYSNGSESEPRKAYETKFLQALGYYDSFEEAIGRAYCYLTETCISQDKDAHISNIYELDDDNGYGLCVKYDDGERNILDWCNILFLPTYESEEQNNG